MTQLQRLQFDMLKCAIDICERLDLRCYLVCGSALGAVKYAGFIPWDDDVDIALLRGDYERFCREAQALLPEYYFLQNSRTDPGAPIICSKLRDSRTTFIEQSVSHLDMNHGVYIDIFPLDGYPDGEKERRRFDFHLFWRKIVLHSVYRMNDRMKPTTKLFLLAERILGLSRNPKRRVDSITALITRYPPEESRLWCNYGNWQGRLEYAPREQYGNGIWATFEGLRVRIPEDYDAYLTQKYGDWRAELPVEQQVGHHYAEVIDLEHPYTDYVEKLPNGRLRLKTLNRP